MRPGVGGRARRQTAASTREIGRFETDTLTTRENRNRRRGRAGPGIERAHRHRPLTRLGLDRDRAVRATDGRQQGAASNGHCGGTCYHPLVVFNQFGDRARVLLRRGNQHRATCWRRVLRPEIARSRDRDIAQGFGGAAAVASPKRMTVREAAGDRSAIRLKANAVLERPIAPLRNRPVGRPSQKPTVVDHRCRSQATSWERARRVVAKIEWQAGELFPRGGFVVTDRRRSPTRVIKFDHGRGTAAQGIKAGKKAVMWTRLSCRRFQDKPARLHLFAWASHLENCLRHRALPRSVRRWSMTTRRDQLITIGAKVVHHARARTFPRAEVAVPRERFAAIRDRIGRLRAGPQLV